MAEPISFACGLTGLVMLAFQASVALYMTVKRYDSLLKHIRNFAQETGALSEVLGSLTETLSASRNLGFSALKVLLRRYGKPYKEF